jgi:integrase
MSTQGPRVRVRDGKGNPLSGLYRRDDKYIAGYQENGRWRTRTLKAATLTEAKRERTALVVGLREGRIASADNSTFAEVFEEWQLGRTIAERTAEHERHHLDRHLATFKGQKVQKIAASDVACLLRGMRDAGYSGWTCSATYGILRGVFSLAVRRGILTRNPVDGLTPSERPRQRNARNVERLDSATIRKLVDAASTERWKAAFALAALGGLRLGEARGLQWGDIDFQANTITVTRSLLPDGGAKPPKTDAGVRVVPLFPELRQLLLTWKLRSPFTDPDDYVVVTGSRGPVQQRNAQRTLAKAKAAAGLDSLEGRLSWHSLRHSAGSVWLTEYGLPVTTVSAMMGHANPSFTLACYGRDPRDTETMVADVLARAAAAGS